MSKVVRIVDPGDGPRALLDVPSSVKAAAAFIGSGKRSYVPPSDPTGIRAYEWTVDGRLSQDAGDVHFVEARQGPTVTVQLVVYDRQGRPSPPAIATLRLQR